jgi:hypothetical protein
MGSLPAEDFVDKLAVALQRRLPGGGGQGQLQDDVLNRHVTGCPACRAWQEQATALRRLTLVREAPQVPDLTARILADAPAPRPQRRGLRVALGLVALVQSGLGLAELLGAHVGHAMPSGLRHIATFCGQCNCGCPELFLAEGASPERAVVITDDFGQRIEMSVEQLAVLVADVKSGVLDGVLTPAG